MNSLKLAQLATRQASQKFSQSAAVLVGEVLAGIVEEDVGGSEKCSVLIAVNVTGAGIVLMRAGNKRSLFIMTWR